MLFVTGSAGSRPRNIIRVHLAAGGLKFDAHGVLSGLGIKWVVIISRMLIKTCGTVIPHAVPRVNRLYGDKAQTRVLSKFTANPL
jgi:hypothetical protein